MSGAQKSFVKIVGGMLILVLSACIPAAFAWMRLNVTAEALQPDEVTIHDARVAARNVVWVDARSEQDYHDGHVPGAILLNEEKLEAGLSKLFEAWQPELPIIVYCNAGCEASHKIADKLRKLGLEPIFVLKGGYEAWKRFQVGSR